MTKWGSEVEVERKRRINVSLWAYAYEVKSDPMVDDATFDRECAAVQPKLATGNRKLDRFFLEEFAPHTGQWIWKHPELHKIATLYTRVRNEKARATTAARAARARAGNAAARGRARSARS